MSQLYIEPDQKSIEVAPDNSILAEAMQQGIPIAHACGGHARCTTCRVYVLQGIENLSPLTPQEEKLSTKMSFSTCVRLACQTHIKGDVSIRRATIEELDPNLYKVQRPEASEISRLGEEKNVSALFADIVGYTPFAERLPAYDVVYILNRYLHMMGQVVKFHWGYIVDYYGDGFFACFEQEGDSDAYMLNAVHAGQEMFKSLKTFNESLSANYQHNFAIRVGIHSGSAVVGTIGAKSMTKKTVIGDSVNMASRIENANKAVGTEFLICSTTYQGVQDQVAIRNHYDVAIEGKEGLYTVHEVDLTAKKGDR